MVFHVAQNGNLNAEFYAIYHKNDETPSMNRPVLS